MINVDRVFRDSGYKAVLLLSVHDEIVFEVHPDESDLVTQRVREIMEGVWDLKVPLKVNVCSGENWAEAH